MLKIKSLETKIKKLHEIIPIEEYVTYTDELKKSIYNYHLFKNGRRVFSTNLLAFLLTASKDTAEGNVDALTGWGTLALSNAITGLIIHSSYKMRKNVAEAQPVDIRQISWKERRALIKLDKLYEKYNVELEEQPLSPHDEEEYLDVRLFQNSLNPSDSC